MDGDRISPDPAGRGDLDGGGDDVAEQRDPDVIQREIEQTRAELAETIDAIADKISPKRAASRGVQAVKGQVSAVLGSDGGADRADRPRMAAGVLDADPARSGKVDSEERRRAIEGVAARGGGAAYDGTSAYTVARTLRTDRVLLVVGATAAAAGLIILWRSRR